MNKLKSTHLSNLKKSRQEYNDRIKTLQSKYEMLMEEKKVKKTANQKVVAKCMKKIEAREAESV